MNHDPMRQPSYVVTMETDRTVSDELSAFLYEQWQRIPAEFLVRGQDRMWLEIYFEDEVKALLAGEVTKGHPHVKAVQVRSTDPADWQKMFRRHFSTREIGDRLRICPVWEQEACPVDDRLTILINPGLSFGTGEHFTTLFCLEAMDRIWRDDAPETMLDIGTGSGILSIAARGLGCSEVVATENADYVLRCTRENLALNGVTDGVELVLSDIVDEPIGGSFDLVCANLYGHLLIECAPQIARPAARWLVLSGIREFEVDGVADAFVARGGREITRDGDGEWAGLLLRFDPVP